LKGAKNNISTRTFWGIICLSVGLITPNALASVRGAVGGIFYDTIGNAALSGWACVQGSAASITVHVYANGTYPIGQLVATGLGNLPSEPAVAAACSSNGKSYRFSIPLSASVRATFNGQNLYVYGVPTYNNGAVLISAGSFSVPPAMGIGLPKGDGITDDTQAVQNLLDAGGNISLAKTYLVSAPLLVGSNTVITLNGKILLKPGFSPSNLQLGTGIFREQWGILQIKNGSSNVVIQGSGTIDGNKAAQNANLCCVGGVVAGGPLMGDYQANISNVTVRGLTIQNIPQWPVSIDGTNGVVLDSLIIKNGGNSVQFAHGTTNGKASNLNISGINDIGFAFYNKVSASSIVNSCITQTRGCGISVISDNPYNIDDNGGQNHDILIQNNLSYANHGGIDTFNNFPDQPNNGSQYRRSYNVAVVGNRTFQNDISFPNGIDLAICDNCSASNNSTTAVSVFQIGIGVFIMNSKGHSCVFSDMNSYLRLTTAAQRAAVVNLSQPPPGVISDGVCNW
jgi:hypothetical protein